MGPPSHGAGQFRMAVGGSAARHDGLPPALDLDAEKAGDFHAMPRPR